MRRRLLIAAGVALVLLAVGALAAYLLVQEQGENVRGSSTEEFVASDPPDAPTATATPETEPEETEPEEPPEGEASEEIPGVVWPTFRFTADRTGVAPFRHRPPYRRIWMFRARNLIEFPPAVAYGRLYFTNNSGVLFAVNAQTGKRAWRYESGRCVASSPAVSNHVVIQTFLMRPPCKRETVRGLTGEVVAFAAGFGRIRWRRTIAPTESSPLVANGIVYVGDWRGVVHALDERTGETRWTFRTRGQIKGALALSGNLLVVGSYDHHVYALDARNGRLRWRAGAIERALYRRGTFFSTPAIAHGRVYVGSTDGRVYSLGAQSGQVRWVRATGGYVYSSPAVWNRTVYVGSYSGRFFALDAATGDVRWEFRANGPVSGSPTVMNGVVYFSTLEERTYGLDARTGRRLWSFPDGKYSPVVADTERVYVVGHARVYGMVPG